MANFSWLVSQLDSIPSINGMDKVISVIHWRAQKTILHPYFDVESMQGIEKEFTADQYGSVSLEAPHEASFTPYSQVTEAIVISWLEALLDCESIEKNLDSQIENFLNPPLIAYNLPWESKI